MKLERKRCMQIGIALFAVLEITAVLVGIWPLITKQKTSDDQNLALRLGVVSQHSKTHSRENWSRLTSKLKKNFNLVVDPYYCNTHEEAVLGLLYGSLDLVIINGVMYNELNQRFGVKPLLLEDFRHNSENNRSILVSRKDEKTNFIDQTRGLRLTNVNRFSLSGSLTATEFIEGKITGKVDDWFANISYAGTHHQSLINLLDNQTDLISVNYIHLKQSMRVLGYSDDAIQILWMSAVLPEQVLCCRSDLDDALQKRIINAFPGATKDKKQDKIFYRRLDEAFSRKVADFADLGSGIEIML